MPKADSGDIISLIFQTGQMLKEKIRQSHDGKDGSWLHVHTLQHIRQQGQATMKDIAAYLHITPPSATAVVNSLVKNGWARRVLDKADRRTVRLQVTPAGLGLLKTSLKKTSLIIRESVNRLSAREKKNFIAILNKIAR